MPTGLLAAKYAAQQTHAASISSAILRRLQRSLWSGSNSDGCLRATPLDLSQEPRDGDPGPPLEVAWEPRWRSLFLRTFWGVRKVA